MTRVPCRNRPSPARYALGVVAYLSYFAANVVFLCVLLPLSLLIAPFGGLRRLAMRAAFHGYLFFLTRVLLPGLGIYRFVEISGLERVQRARPVVLVSNHRSRIDALVLLGMFPGAGTVIKSTYARLPVFSSFIRHLDFVEVNQESMASIAAALVRCKRLLESGGSILVFPEGTRARTGRLMPFRDLAFRVAAESGVPVAPVVVHTDLPFMAKRQGSIFPARRMRCTVRFLALETLRQDERTADLADRVYRTMAREIEKLDNGTPWEL